jgi:sucrose-6-phosphatase
MGSLIQPTLPCAVQKEAPLLVPDVLVCSVGTEIFFESAGEADQEWGRELDQGWDRQGALDAAAGIPELKQQVQALLKPQHVERRTASMCLVTH